MDSVRKANNRMRSYPLVFGKCSVQGAAYATCVTQDFTNITLKACDKEFQLFKDCLKKAACEMKTKL